MLDARKRLETEDVVLDRSRQSDTQAIHSAAVMTCSSPAAGRKEQKREGEGAMISTFPVRLFRALDGYLSTKARDS